MSENIEKKKAIERPFIFIMGLLMLFITLLAYTWQPRGTPINWFWIPFAVIFGVGPLILGMKPKKN